MIDSFFVRAGDVLAALSIYVGTTFLAFGATQFALVNLGLWSGVAVLALFTGQGYARRTGVAR